jgi:tellurite resistance protein
MRTYSVNSPQAAARIVALALTSDGHVCSSEERALETLDIAGELGLAPEQFAQIVQTLCEDISVGHMPVGSTASHVDANILATVMDEVDDPVLRRRVIRLCVAVAVADHHLADGEIAFLAALSNAWGLEPTAFSTRRRATLHVRTAATT